MFIGWQIGRSTIQIYCFFFFNDTATTEIYTLSLHDALPICSGVRSASLESPSTVVIFVPSACRSEEHTSQLQSHHDLVCRLLLEKNKDEWVPVGFSILKELSRCVRHGADTRAAQAGAFAGGVAGDGGLRLV